MLPITGVAPSGMASIRLPHVHGGSPSRQDHDPPGQLWLVVDGGVKKWACLSCPGGCGVQISLSLNPDRRPRWSVESDFWGRPTVSPSIHQQKQCRCHFWIRKGLIEWCL
ncbi:DUF6527 family protein [Thermomonas brevis]|uniref:DUF6527 family protein n=1 Tax=Thermomonas brevis TaxID=215691 RepID=UPI003CCE51BD